MTDILDKGYVRLIESWGSDERIIEAARMSTAKGFKGWGPKCKCGAPGDPKASERNSWVCRHCNGEYDPQPGDEKLLKYLWDNRHATPFEMAGMTIEVKAPIFVFREWHRHRTQSYNEMSARYVPLPDENYIPDLDRLFDASKTNKQAGVAKGARELTEGAALGWLEDLEEVYRRVDRLYREGLDLGIPKEVARICLPVGRYSCMRASANLRNWLAFLTLRCDNAAQWEIRQYANEVARLIAEHFPRTYEVAKESIGL